MPRSKFQLLALSLGFTCSAFAALNDSIEESIGNFSLTATDHVIVSSKRDSSDPTRIASNLLMHEDELRAQFNEYSGQFQFSNRIPFSAGQESLKTFFAFEKATLSGEWSNLVVKLGDSHQEIGKGIALSLYRDDVFGIDNTLQGGYFRFRPMGVEVTGMAGRINSIKAPVAINAVPNPLANREVYVAAGEAKAKVTKEGKLGVQYVFGIQQPNNASRFDHRWTTFGGTFQQNNVIEGVDFYAEGNLLVNQLLVGNHIYNLPQGRGNYASLTWAPESWRVKWEAKDFRQDSFDFRRSPTLEEDLVETVNTTDVSASRLSVERKLGRSSVTGSTLVGYDDNQARVFYHGVMGAKIRGESPSKLDLEIKTGYRWMPQREDMIHATVTAKVRTGKGQSVELGARKQLKHEKLNTTPLQDDRNVFSAGYNFSERIFAGLGYEYVPSNAPELGNHFVNLNASFKSGDLTAKGFLGQTSGGTVCSGGVCRQVPPYTGALIETIYIF